MSNEAAPQAGKEARVADRDRTDANVPDVDHDDPLFFYGEKNAFGQFSQWARSTFVVSKARIAEIVERSVDDVESPEGGLNSDDLTFNRAEQFMMFCKAVRFGDHASQQRLLASDDPGQQKQLGRRVRDFDEMSWDAVKSRVVLAASVAKFGQSAKLRQLLLSTGNRLLVEAAPFDRVWGIGYRAEAALAHRDTWGENRLGWVLMAARAQLRAE